MLSLLLNPILLSICNSQWISPSTTKLPRADDGIAAGSYNDSIYLMGGALNGYQLVQYDITQDSFIDHGSSVFPNDLFGEASYFAQIDNILYIIDRAGDTLLTYNMETDTFNDNYHTIPSNVGMYACLASRPGYLYVIGGKGENLNSVQVLDITTNGWLNSVPSMQEPRVGHACTIDPSSNTLYAIGGYTWSNDAAATHIDTVEKIDTNSIAQSTWSYLTGALLVPSGFLRSVIHNNLIYVIGGAYGTWNAWDLLDTVNIIDVTLNTVSVSSDRLLYQVSSTASIIVDNIIYVFGGYTGSAVDTWMMYELATDPVPTTDDPTTNPSTKEATTENPTTSEPTTREPTTDKPTTREPTTNKPTQALTLTTTTETTDEETTDPATTTDDQMQQTVTSTVSLVTMDVTEAATDSNTLDATTNEPTNKPTTTEATNISSFISEVTTSENIVIESTETHLNINQRKINEKSTDIYTVESTNNVKLMDTKTNNLENIIWIVVTCVAVCILVVFVIIFVIRKRKQPATLEDVKVESVEQRTEPPTMLQVTSLSHTDHVKSYGEDLVYVDTATKGDNDEKMDHEGDWSASSSEDDQSMYEPGHDGPQVTVTAGGNEEIELEVYPAPYQGQNEQNVQTPRGGEVGACVDCGKTKWVKICEEDGLFYCDVCWEYYAIKALNTMEAHQEGENESNINAYEPPPPGQVHATQPDGHYKDGASIDGLPSLPND